MPSEAEEDAVGLLPLYYLLNILCGYGEEVYLRPRLGIRLNCCNVRIDEYNFDSFLLQRFQALGTAVIEFGGLTDLDCTAAEDKRLFDPFMPWRI